MLLGRQHGRSEKRPGLESGRVTRMLRQAATLRYWYRNARLKPEDRQCWQLSGIVNSRRLHGSPGPCRLAATSVDPDPCTVTACRENHDLTVGRKPYCLTDAQGAMKTATTEL